MKTRVLALCICLALLLGVPASASDRPLWMKSKYTKDEAVYPTVIQVAPKKLTLLCTASAPGTGQLTAATKPDLGTLTDPTVTWTSLDESVAIVDERGLVTATGLGTTRVRAAVRTETSVIYAECAVTAKGVKPQSVTLDQEEVRLDPTDDAEKTVRLHATVKPLDAAFTAVSWSSSDEGIATVDQNGLVTAVGTGTAIITASAGKASAKCRAIVRDRSAMKRIVVTAGGDVVLGGDKQRGSYQRFKQFVNGENGVPDYGYVFKNLKSLLAEDDITIVNLEGPLTDTGGTRRGERTYCFGAPPEYGQILRDGSVEVANIVNNHTADYSNGRELTRRALKKYGLYISDFSISNKNMSSTTMLVDGVRVGFVGIQTPRTLASIESTVKSAKKRCDVLIVSLHYCDVPEYNQSVRGTQIGAARTAVRAGAALVIGTHPHVLSGFEQYRGACIYYDLGSLVMAGENGRHKTYLARQTILYDPETGATESEDVILYPAFTSGYEYKEKVNGKWQKKNNCQPQRFEVGTALSNDVVREIKKYSAKLKYAIPFEVA